MKRTQRRSQRGAAAVEFALVLVPLVLIVFGTIDFGYYFFLREIATNAAREGARIASTSFGGQAERCNAGRVGATLYLRRVGLPAKAGETVTEPCLDASGAQLSVDPEACCIRVDYPSGSLTGFVVLQQVVPAKASAQAQMRLEAP